MNYSSLLWKKAMFSLEVLIYKRLQIWRHNYVIRRNKYLFSTFSESTVPQLCLRQFLLKSPVETWNKLSGRFFWTQRWVSVFERMSTICSASLIYNKRSSQTDERTTGRPDINVWAFYNSIAYRQCWNWPKRTWGSAAEINVWNVAQGLKSVADFHSKMSFCRQELGVQPPTPRQFQPCL